MLGDRSGHGLRRKVKVVPIGSTADTVEKTSGFSRALNRILGILLPLSQVRTLTVRSVEEGVSIEPLYSAPCLAVIEVPCRWVTFEELPGIQFTSYRDGFVPGAKVEVTLLVDRNGELVERRV